MCIVIYYIQFDTIAKRQYDTAQFPFREWIYLLSDFQLFLLSSLKIPGHRSWPLVLYSTLNSTTKNKIKPKYLGYLFGAFF